MQGNDIYVVSLGCRAVHHHLDYRMSHAEMEAAVLKAIKLHGGLITPPTDPEEKQWPSN